MLITPEKSNFTLILFCKPTALTSGASDYNTDPITFFLSEEQGLNSDLSTTA